MALNPKYNKNCELIQDSLFTYLSFNNKIPNKVNEIIKVITTPKPIKLIFEKKQDYVVEISTLVFDSQEDILQQAKTFILIDYFHLESIKKLF